MSFPFTDSTIIYFDAPVTMTRDICIEPIRQFPHGGTCLQVFATIRLTTRRIVT